ncbi:Na+/H+ antiporter subunit E [Ottowia sp.]|uniref:Na+/H+ antiporter subunit E n=1 Tax=Ottowia sp. TaxID=1898956 RepID=UPI0025DB8418|nr:Na+/H+ antiporter subunit E [Ottowia sp.]
MMKRLFPAPLMSAALMAMWLVLNASLAAGDVLLAVLLGLVVPALLAPLRPARPRIRHPLTVLRLIGVVGLDVLESNWLVLRTLLTRPGQPTHARFVRIPLDLRDPSALAALAVITTVVPGTVWCELARDSSALLLHVWDAPDEAAFIARYKERYEQPLREIFES